MAENKTLDYSDIPQLGFWLAVESDIILISRALNIIKKT